MLRCLVSVTLWNGCSLNLEMHVVLCNMYMVQLSSA